MRPSADIGHAARDSSPRAVVLALVLAGCGPTAPVPTETDSTATTSNDDAPPPSTSPSQSDEGPGDPTDAPRSDLPSPADTSGGADTGVDPIECVDFDPARVYLRGTLEQGADYLQALADPSDPTRFCVGFEFAGFPRIRPSDRRIVFVDESDGGGVLEFTPDSIGVDLKGEWIYPDDPYGNDALLMPSPCNGEGLGPILLSPIDGRVWYRCGSTWYDPDGQATWFSSEGDGVAIAPDGRLLVHELSFASAIYLAAPGRRPSSALQQPREIDALVTGRVHDDGLWLVAIDDDRMFRWYLVGETIVEEGEYSEIAVEDQLGSEREGVLDGNGDYVHLGTTLDDATNDMIVRRRLAPQRSEIVYLESDAAPDAVKVYLSEVFTGP